ncbi:hypothetical protein J6X04_03365 [Candidatus Saccharibacteria bacterium]|nr:hypothetical protein [Candidatus Saccharibacteria bacterium]
MKNPFLKRLMKETKNDVVHTSAYADAQNAGKIGVASTQGFRERRRIDQNRKIVKKYRHSGVVAETRRNAWKARQEMAQFGSMNNSGNVGENSGLRGSLKAVGDTKIGGKDGGSLQTRGPAQMPARKNPGISR